MKKLLLLVVAVAATIFSANAQVKIESPHPDLDIQITRCAYASGTVVIDMVITNYGSDQTFTFQGAGRNATLTTAYDDEGNQYTGSNSRIQVGLTSQGLSSYLSHCDLPQDVPMKFRVQIEKVNNQAAMFKLLKIGFYQKVGDSKPIVIRNLEWTK